MRLPAFLLLLTAGLPVLAQGVQMQALDPDTARAIRPVVEAAHRSFDRMPALRLTSRIGALCGGDGATSGDSRYCTSENVIFVASGLAERLGAERAAYVVAHQMGHAVQVRHGVADLALARITAARSREAELRGMVVRQVECIAGVLLARAGLDPPDLVREPFTGSHWGRAPMAGGPRVTIGIDARRKWLAAGYRKRDLSVCAVGEFGADLLLRADRDR